jgi:hypothetical protein
MRPIDQLLREKNIQLDSQDPVLRYGFVQMPNFILRNPELSVGAKVTYAMFLSYAWNNDFCFPGQERLAQDMGMSRSRVTEFIGQLEDAGLISIQRRGLGKTNIYTVHAQVEHRHPDVGGPTSRRRPMDLRSQPADISLYKNTQKKNTGDILLKGCG